MPVIRAVDESGRTIDDPTRDELGVMLANMNMRFRFVIVERHDREPSGQHYIQTYLEDDLSYRVEYRDGSASQHFWAIIAPQSEITGVEPVCRLMDDWIHDRPGWRQALPWQRWEPDAAPSG